MTRRKASLFFTTDTLVAVIVLVGTYLILQSSVASDTRQVDPKREIIELDQFLGETTVEDLLSEYPTVYDPPGMSGQEDAWRRELTLYQELNYLDNNGYDANATELLKRVSDLVISNRFSYTYSVNGKTFLNNTQIPINQTPTYVTKRVLIYSPTAGGGQIIGPNKTKIAIWL